MYLWTCDGVKQCIQVFKKSILSHCKAECRELQLPPAHAFPSSFARRLLIQILQQSESGREEPSDKVSETADAAASFKSRKSRNEEREKVTGRQETTYRNRQTRTDAPLRHFAERLAAFSVQMNAGLFPRFSLSLFKKYLNKYYTVARTCYRGIIKMN